MARVSVSQEIAAPASAVWGAIGDMAHAATWPAVEHCAVEGSGAGCLRTLRLIGGAIVRERVESHDDAARRYDSQVFELGHLPLKDMHYSVSVSETGPDRCVVDWLATFEPAGVSEERACLMIERLCATSMITIREEVESR